MISKLQMLFPSLLAISLAACSGSIGGNVSVRTVVDPPPPPAAGIFGDGRLDQLVEWSRASYGLPAMGVVVVVNGQVVEIAAEGLRSATASARVTDADLWHLGSLTKGITSTLAGVLVEHSVLSWDTRPLDVWPELDGSIHSQLRDITLRQLLSHTAGIRRVDAAPSAYGDLAAGTIIDKRRAFAADLLAEAPASAIGQQSYSNGGYIIAGAMMETLMSASWETLVESYVFAALDMNESGFGAPGVPGDLSQPWGHWDQGINYDPVSPGPEADNPQVFGPAGTVHGTMRDYAKFMIAHIDGFRGIDGFLTSSTYSILHTPLHQGSALGWGVSPSEDEPGATELGHAGSNLRWYSVVRLVPELDAGALFVVNAGGEMASGAIDALDDLLTERFDNSR